MIRPRVANKRLLNFTPGSYNNREQIDDCDCYQIHTPQCSRIFDVLAIRKVLFISFKETHPKFVLLKITSQGVNTQDCQDKGCIPFITKKIRAYLPVMHLSHCQHLYWIFFLLTQSVQCYNKALCRRSNKNQSKEISPMRIELGISCALV